MIPSAPVGAVSPLLARVADSERGTGEAGEREAWRGRERRSPGGAVGWSAPRCELLGRACGRIGQYPKGTNGNGGAARRLRVRRKVGWGLAEPMHGGRMGRRAAVPYCTQWYGTVQYHRPGRDPLWQQVSKRGVPWPGPAEEIWR